jgi:hypothetical protein
LKILYHVASVQLLHANHAAYDLSNANLQLLEPQERTIKFVLPYKPAKTCDYESLANDTPDPDALIPSTPVDTSFGPDSQAPYSKSFVDAEPSWWYF